MSEFFHLKDSHGNLLGINITSGEICGLSPEADDSRFRCLMVLVLSCRPDLVFFYAGDSYEVEIFCHGHSYRSHLIPMLIERDDHVRSYAFRFPDSKRYICIGPIQSGHDHSNIASSEIRQAWENFELLLLPRSQISLLDWNLVDSLDAVYFGASLSSSLIRLLDQEPSSALRLALQSMTLLLDLAELQQIAIRICADSDLVARLALHLSHDFWAVSVLPSLQIWSSERRSNATREITSVAEDGQIVLDQKNRKRVLDESYDFLANAGAYGNYVSLGHACNAACRRLILPTRTVCVVATARNEGLYLLEWIAYYRLIGVEDFFIYSNDNEDASDNLYSALADSGVINWIDNQVSGGGSAQYKAYGHACGVLPEILDFKWVIVVDLDEFLVYSPGKFKSIVDYLSWDEFVGADAICINWIAATSNKQTVWSDTPVVERFPVLRNGINAHVKTVFRPGTFIHSSPHFPRTDQRLLPVFVSSSGRPHAYGRAAKEAGLSPAEWPAMSDEPDTTMAGINHYFYKSAEEFLWKASRNRGDHPKESGITKEHKLLPFFRAFLVDFDETAAEFDRRILFDAPALNEEIEKLRLIPGVAEAESEVRKAFRRRMLDVLAFYRSPPPDLANEATARIVTLATRVRQVEDMTQDVAGVPAPSSNFVEPGNGRRPKMCVSKITPIIHIEPKGGVGNRMIQYMAALSIKERIPEATISNVHLPEWGLQVEALATDEVDGGLCKNTLRIGRRYNLLDLDAIADCLRQGIWKSIIVDGFCQHIDNLSSAQSYKDIFVPPKTLDIEIPHFDHTYIVISIRGAEILDGHHMDYVQIPADFYAHLIAFYKLKPVFFGQIEDNLYCADLRRRFPTADFIKGRGGIFDFEVLRRSKNIVPSISTFSWLAAFLSSGSRIFLPVLGIFNPMQARNHNFLPLNDARYEFFLFPICYSENIRDEAAFWQAQQSLEGRWRKVQPNYIRQLLSRSPMIKPTLGPYLRWFDETFYLSKYLDVRHRVDDGTFGSGLQHFCDHGFEGPAHAFPFSDRFYSRTYPDAAWEVSSGEYLDLRHHFVEVGFARGHKPTGDLGF